MIALNIYDSALTLKATINNNNDRIISKAEQTSSLENFTETFTFTAKQNKYIKELNYVSFFDNNKDLKLYQIVDTDYDFKAGTVTCYCESASLQLIGKVFEEYEAPEAYTIQQYFNMFLQDSIFQVRNNNIPDLKRTLGWTSAGSALSRILSVANSFEVELSYSASFKNNRIDCIYIDIHKQIGRDTNKTLSIDNESLTSFNKQVDVKTLRTAVIAKGSYLSPEDEIKEEVAYNNLIRNSDFSEGTKHWRFFYGTAYVDSLPESEVIHYEEPKATSKNKTGFYFKQKAKVTKTNFLWQELTDLIPGKVYTINYKNPSNINMFYYGDLFLINDLDTMEAKGTAGYSVFTEQDSASSRTFTFTATTKRHAIAFRIRDRYNTEAYIKLYDLQIVEGNFTTANVPAWSDHISAKPPVNNDTYTNIKDIDYDDGSFKSPKGDNRIYAYKANEKYRRNYKVINAGYLDDIFQYETDNSQELFNRAINHLKKVSEPAVSYTTSINTLKSKAQLNTIRLGDTYNVTDTSSLEKIYLKARIYEVFTDYINQENSTVTLGNYYLTQTKFSKSFDDLRNQLDKTSVAVDNKEKVLVIESDKSNVVLNNNIDLTLQAKVLQGAIDVTNLYNTTDFAWFKYDKNNVLQQSWSYANQNTNKIVLTKTEDIDGFATYVCKIKNTDLEARYKVTNIITTIASTTPPANPKVGEHWLDLSKSPAVLYIYTANGFLNISEITLSEEVLNQIKVDVENNLSEILNGKENAIFKQSTPPENPVDGAIWIDTSKDINIAYRYDATKLNWFKLSITEMEEIILKNGDTLAEVIVRIQQKITDDSILNTVIKSKSFTNVVDKLVNTEDLLNYMSQDDYDRLSDDLRFELMKEINDSIEGKTQVIMTQFEQLADQFNLSIKNGGGVNHIRNSLGFAKDSFWTKANNNPFYTYVDQMLKKLNLYSGFELRAETSTKKQNLSQKIAVAPNLKYTFSFLGKGLKNTNNRVILREIGNTTRDIYFQREQFTNEYEKFTFTFTTQKDTKQLEIVLVSEDATSSFFVSALMLNLGTALEWQQHATEFYNTNTIIDINGISVLSNINEIYTQITNESFEIYREVDGIVKKVLSVNSDLTEIDNLKVNNEMIFNNIILKRLKSDESNGFGFFKI